MECDHDVLPVKQHSSSTGYYCVSIVDNGIGFDPEHNERILQVFQRLHGRAGDEGSGIGLAICKKIMENHNGFLLAEGRPGQGATFKLYFPNN